MIKGYCYPQEKEAFHKRQTNEIIIFKYRNLPQMKQVVLDDSRLQVIDKISFWLVKRI